MALPDPIRSLIREKAQEHGLTLAHISRTIGRNAAYMQQFMSRNVPRTLPEHVRERLAEILKIEADDLRGTEVARGGPRQVGPNAIAATREEEELLETYRKAAPESKRAILNSARGIAERL